MKNLAGVENVDNYIRQELKDAGIQTVQYPRNKGEVPYTLTGVAGPWTLKRAWYYWDATAPNGNGLPLDIAKELHNKSYPTLVENREGRGNQEPEKYGDVVRVEGDCGCPPPEEWAFPEFKELSGELEKSGIKTPISYNDIRRLCDTGEIAAPRFVDTYHIDTQEGLNEFVRVVKNSC